MVIPWLCDLRMLYVLLAFVAMMAFLVMKNIHIIYSLKMNEVARCVYYLMTMQVIIVITLSLIEYLIG